MTSVPDAVSEAPPRRSRLRAFAASPVPEVLLAALPFVILCLRHLDFLPLWDGDEYFGDLLDAARRTLNPLHYNFCLHPTMGYLWPLGLIERLSERSYRVVILFNATLGLLGFTAFHGLLRRIWPTGGKWERMLATALFASSPVLVASAVQLTPDFGATIFSLCLFHALAREKLGRALLWGVLASLSKESGIMLYGLAVAAYLIAYVTRAEGTTREKLRALGRRWLLFVPIGLGAVAAVIALARGAVSAVGGGAGDMLRQLISVSFLDDKLPAVLAVTFVLNFMWMPAGIVFARGLVAGSRALGRVLFDVRHAVSAREPAWTFSWLLFVLATFLLTRVRTFTNVRYYLPLVALLLLLLPRCMEALGLRPALQRIFLAIMLALFLFANFRSRDAFSVRVFHTFPVGKPDMYEITSMTGECCGWGRDQLVYNLEFTELHRLLDKALPWILAHPDAVIGIYHGTDWHIIDSVDPLSHQRALPGPNAFRPKTVTIEQLQSHEEKPPPIVYYLEMPNMPDEMETGSWSALYTVGEPRVFEDNGYELAVRELRLR